METRIRALLNQGLGHQVSVALSASVDEAIGVMEAEGADSVAVVHEGAVCGVLSHPELIRCVGCMNAGRRGSEDTAVARVMTTPVPVVQPEQTVREVVHRMTVRRARYASVVEQGRFVALLSMSELCVWLERDLDGRVAELTQYICGQPANPGVFG